MSVIITVYNSDIAEYRGDLVEPALTFYEGAIHAQKWRIYDKKDN